MSLYWFLCGNESTPSSRIHGINIHNKLQELGYSSLIIFKPYRFVKDIYYSNFFLSFLALWISKNDTVIVQKLDGTRIKRFLVSLHHKGIRIVFIDCDLPLKLELATLANLVICPSQLLCNYYKEAGILNVNHIDDAVELYLPPKRNTNKKGTIVWFGKSGLGKWNAVDWFKKEVLNHIEDRWEFITISDHIDATYPWKAETAPALINGADLVIIPSTTSEADLVKSANRCTQSFALGLPVLCHEVPSYKEVVRDFHNGSVSNDKNDWLTYIRKLEDKEFLWQSKQNAFESSKAYGLNEIINKWTSVLELNRDRHTASKNSFLPAIIALYDWWFNIKRILAVLLFSKNNKE